MKRGIFILVLFFGLYNVLFAEEYISLESSLYDYLLKLEAEGYISSAQLTTLPISKREALRLLKEGEGKAASDDKAMEVIKKAKDDLKDEGFNVSAALDYAYTEKESFLYNRNKNGIETKEGNNVKFELPFSYSYKNFGVAASPYFLSNENYENINFRELYVLGTYSKEEFSLGKLTQWWGGGKRGSLLLSNNAESLNVLRISNSTPYEIFVPFRFTFFLAKLENNRQDIKSPLLQGIRLTLKPSPYLEIGLSKTGMYGGRGRKSDLGAFFDSLIGNKEKNTTSNVNNEPGDQRAGFDVKLIFPNDIQPFTFYFEAIGEDVNHDFPYPYKFAYIYSLYLPRFFNIYNLEILTEYSQTTYKQKGLWYNHHIFTQGYTYNGDIIGDYIGSDAKDFYLKLRYNFDKSKVDVIYERYRRYIPDFVWESYKLSFLHNLTKKFSWTFETGVNNEDKSAVIVAAGLKFKF